MKSEFKSIVNEFVENAILSSSTITTMIKNMQTLTSEFSKMLSVLVKIHERLNKHEEAILQLCENKIAKKVEDSQTSSPFDPPKTNKPSQKPN